MIKRKRRRPNNPTVDDDKCTIRVVQTKRGPSRSPSGIRRRPRIIKEVVTRYYHCCDWCDSWFAPDRANQRYCDVRCRHSSFRDRAREELADLRKQV